MGVAEKQHHHLAMEIGQAATLAIVVGELQFLTPIGTSNIGTLERAFTRCTGTGIRATST